MIDIRKVVEGKGANFLAYLQSNLLVPGCKPLTEREKYVLSLWKLSIERYDRYCKFYHLMENYLKDNNFDYING